LGFFGRTTSQKEIVVDKKIETPGIFGRTNSKKELPVGKKQTVTITKPSVKIPEIKTIQKPNSILIDQKKDVKENKGDVMPDLDSTQVQDATLKIQSAYRGFKTRKELKESGEELPDLKAKDVVAATIIIQAAYKGFRTRKMVEKHKEIMPDLNCAQVQDATIKIQSAYRGFKTRKELRDSGQDLPDLKAADVVAATIKIQSAYKGFQTRKMIKKHKEVLPDLNCAQVQDATVKIQSAYRGFKTRKQLKDSGEDLPNLKCANVAAATLKIQAYYRGFKTRKAIRDQQARQDQARADVAEAAMRVRLLPTERSKKLIRNTPKTPMQSIDLPNPPSIQLGRSKQIQRPVKSSVITKPYRPTAPPSIIFPEKGQRLKKSVPQRVDERDFKRIPRKPLGKTPEIVQEDRSRELANHPADVVCAAMTIQRFFKSVKAKKENARKENRHSSITTESSAYDSEDMSEFKNKVKGQPAKTSASLKKVEPKRQMSTTTESSADDSSNYDPSQSDSSETDNQQRRDESSSKDSSDTSETESDEESRKTVRVDSVKRRKIPPKPDDKEIKSSVKVDSPKKTNVTKQKRKIPSDSSDSDSDTQGKRPGKPEPNKKDKRPLPKSKEKIPLSATATKSDAAKVKPAKTKVSAPAKLEQKNQVTKSKIDESELIKAEKIQTEKYKMDVSIKKAETATQIETKSKVMGFFGGGKVKEKKEVVKIEEPAEKKNVFSFFGRTSTKKETPTEEKVEAKQSKPETVAKPVNKPRQKSVEAQKMSVITTFRGAEPKPRKYDDDLPDLKAADVAAATLKIQSAYKGYKTRQMIKKHKEVMPDLNCAQVEDATLKIQSAYRGFKTRKELKEAGGDLPDLKADDVVNATIKIQSAYKGFKTRQMIKKT